MNNDARLGTGTTVRAAVSDTSSTTPNADQGVNTLVGGIVSDMQALIGQHLELLRQEILSDFRKTKQAFGSFALAAALALITLPILICALIGYLSWAIPDVPWWGWSSILGGLTAAVAVALYVTGKRKLASFNPLPDESVQAVKDNLKWITDRVSTEPRP